MGRIVLVTGGARSSKSRYGQDLVEKKARERGSRPLYVATAQAFDEEMEDRIRRHQADRGASWVTLEAPLSVADALSGAISAHPVVLIDCLTLLSTNILMAHENEPAAVAEAAVTAEVEAICQVARDSDSMVVLVTNEVGMGVVPDSPLGRLFRDIAGRANQVAASRSDEVVFMVSGIPMVIKGDAANL